MITTLRNAFKVKEIRQRVLFTFLMLVVIRVASQLPTPGVNRDYFAEIIGNIYEVVSNDATSFSENEYNEQDNFDFNRLKRIINGLYENISYSPFYVKIMLNK